MALCCGVAEACLWGCAATPSVLDIVDHRSSGETRRYHEAFDEAYYDVDSSGGLTLVLRRSQAARGSLPDVTQIVVVKSVWRSIPGTTIAQDTQINGTVIYAVLSGRSGTTFEGAGSLFYTPDPKSDELSGSLDLATLQPRRRMGGDDPIFDRAEVSGQFVARRNPRNVRRIANDLERQFGAGKG